VKKTPPDLLRCPTCESNDVMREGVEDRWFRKRTRYQCRACGRVFRKGAEKDKKQVMANDDPSRCVAYPVLRCPACRSKDVATHTTRPPDPDGARRRYHKCRICGYDFSSLEA